MELQKIIKEALNLIDGLEIDDDSMSSDSTPHRTHTEEQKYTQGNCLEYDEHRSSMQRLKTVENDRLSHDSLYNIDVPNY